MTRIDMATSEWHALITPVLPHASTDKDSPELQAVRIEKTGLAVYAVATDRYTLAAERQPFPPGDVPPGLPPPVHIHASEAAASLRLFRYSKDDDPELRVIIDTTSVPITAAGHQASVDRQAVTLQAGDGTRLVLRDCRDSTRDPLAGWQRRIRTAMDRTTGRALDGLDLNATQLARWVRAVRDGERLTVYTGPEPGDPLLVTVEQHFAGVWAIPRYLDGPGKVLTESPWQHELNGTGDDT